MKEHLQLPEEPIRRLQQKAIELFRRFFPAATPTESEEREAYVETLTLTVEDMLRDPALINRIERLALHIKNVPKRDVVFSQPQVSSACESIKITDISLRATLSIDMLADQIDKIILTVKVDQIFSNNPQVYLSFRLEGAKVFYPLETKSGRKGLPNIQSLVKNQLSVLLTDLESKYDLL